MGGVSGERRPRGRPPAGSRPVDDGALLAVALEAFGDDGFEGTSVRDVCRRVAVSHNYVHQRFGSKEDLWFAAVDRAFSELAADLAAALDPDPGDDVERLRAVLVRFIELSAASPALLRVMNAEATRPGPRLDHMYDRFIGPAATVIGTVLRRLERAGRLGTVDPATLHFLVAHGAGAPLSLTGLAAKFGMPARSDPPAVSRYAHDVVELLLGGMVRAPSREEPS